MKYSHLFSPGKIGNLTLKNRIISGPATMCYAEPDGKVNDRLVEFYRCKAAGGVGMIIVEGSYISDDSKGYAGQISIANDSMIPGLARMAKAMKEAGTIASIQIQHCGRRAKKALTGVQPLAPSAIPVVKGADVPKEMSEEDIARVFGQFADAAWRAKQAGFDAIDIHSAHGYLPAAFMSPSANKRTDSWGGDLTQRCRFAVEVIKAIKRRVGDDFPVTIKLSADEFTEDGLKMEDTAVIVKLLEQAGIAAILVSAGAPSDYSAVVYEQPVTYMRTMPMATKPGCLVYLAKQVKKLISVPVITLGRLNDPDVAEDILAKGEADFIAITRALITDPQLPNKIKEGRIEDIRPCISCNEGCYNKIMSGQQIECACNPESGFEYLDRLKPVEQKKKIVIVGGGISGMQAALTSNERGHQVTLIEKSSRLGGQLWMAYIPPDRNEIGKINDYMIRTIEKKGIDVRLNTKANQELLSELAPDALIIAAGAVPLLPSSLIKDADYITAHEVLAGGKTYPGESVLVIGGGLVGSETADYLAQNGSKVTLVEMQADIANDTSGEERKFFKLKFQHFGVEVLTSTTVESLNGTVATLKCQETTDQRRFDRVVLAIGSRSERQIEGLDLDNSPEDVIINKKRIPVYYCGDCVKARKIHDAFYEGYEVGLNA